MAPKDWPARVMSDCDDLDFHPGDAINDVVRKVQQNESTSTEPRARIAFRRLTDAVERALDLAHKFRGSSRTSFDVPIRGLDQFRIGRWVKPNADHGDARRASLAFLPTESSRLHPRRSALRGARLLRPMPLPPLLPAHRGGIRGDGPPIPPSQPRKGEMLRGEDLRHRVSWGEIVSRERHHCELREGAEAAAGSVGRS